MGDALLVLAVPLMMRIPDVLPSSVDVDSGALIGCLFAGSATYFAWGALRPRWPYAAGPLIALLVYDLILVLPLVTHLPVARPEHVAVLVAYFGVLVTTAPLCAAGLALRHVGSSRRAS